MVKNVAIASLARVIRAHPRVEAIGLSGRPFPETGGDWDIFVYCSEPLSPDERFALLEPCDEKPGKLSVQVLSGGYWGNADYCLFRGTDTWLMYFTSQEAQTEVETYLQAPYLDRLQGSFYPTGRLGMWQHMTALYDPYGFLKHMKT